MSRAFTTQAILVLTLIIQGCSQHPTNKPLHFSSDSDTKESSQNKLGLCLQNADALVKSNSKYKKDVDHLYQTLNSSKFYASISNNITSDVSSTITPLYEYKVNDLCNKISQNLINELKGKVSKESDNGGTI